MKAKKKKIHYGHTFRTEPFSIMARHYNNISCTGPSTLQLLDECCVRTRCHCLPEMCTDVFSETHARLANKGLFPNFRHIAIL